MTEETKPATETVTQEPKVEAPKPRPETTGEEKIIKNPSVIHGSEPGRPYIDNDGTEIE